MDMIKSLPINEERARIIADLVFFDYLEFLDEDMETDAVEATENYRIKLSLLNEIENLYPKIVQETREWYKALYEDRSVKWI